MSIGTQRRQHLSRAGDWHLLAGPPAENRGQARAGSPGVDVAGGPGGPSRSIASRNRVTASSKAERSSWSRARRVAPLVPEPAPVGRRPNRPSAGRGAVHRGTGDTRPHWPLPGCARIPMGLQPSARRENMEFPALINAAGRCPARSPGIMRRPCHPGAIVREPTPLRPAQRRDAPAATRSTVWTSLGACASGRAPFLGRQPAAEKRRPQIIHAVLSCGPVRCRFAGRVLEARRRRSGSGAASRAEAPEVEIRMTVSAGGRLLSGSR